MGDEILVKVDGVSKKFCRSLKKSLWYGMCDMASEIVGGKGSHEKLRNGEFWAVNDVSFELRRGECLGLIGRNGAGKTTLLKMLNGLIKPDCGRIEMRGRVGALIALGAGFNPILTGRENIFVNGSVLGLTKREIDGKLEEIIDFADIREFIDSPVQSYSSGMQVRLGFAVATALEPDVLLLDEVLAVGDAAFRAKCYERIGRLMNNCGVIFVSHSMDQVRRITTQCLLLDAGCVKASGGSDTAISLYERLNFNDASGVTGGNFCRINRPIMNFRACLTKDLIEFGEKIHLSIQATSEEEIEVFARMQFYNKFNEVSGETRDVQFKLRQASDHHFVLNIGPMHLKAGIYSLSLLITSANGLSPLVWSYKKEKCEIRCDARVSADYVIPAELGVD